jgi:hypothetical protein
MPVLIVYVGVLLLGLASVVVRNGPHLLKGTHWLAFNLAFLVFSIVWFLFDRTSGIDPLVIFVFALVSGLSACVSTRWFVFKPGQSGIHEIIENSFSGVLIDFKRSTHRYLLQLNDIRVTELVIQPLVPGCVMILFKGVWRTPRTAVFQKLLAKRFSGMFHKITLHM